MNKAIENGAKAIAGIGALNWGLSLASINLLEYAPTGIIKTAIIAAIGASGAYVLYLLYEKKI